MELLMRKLYSLWGSNPRPMAHKTIALTTELREHCIPVDSNMKHTRILSFDVCLTVIGAPKAPGGIRPLAASLCRFGRDLPTSRLDLGAHLG